MYDDDERDEFDFDDGTCEDCPFYRQRPPIFGPSGPKPPQPPKGPGPGPGPGGGPGPGKGPSAGPPQGPPPAMKPKTQQKQGIGVQAVDPGAIRRCMYRYVYLELDNGREFWAWLTFVGRRSVAGWRWTGYRWVYFGTDLRRIDSFYCY